MHSSNQCKDSFLPTGIFIKSTDKLSLTDKWLQRYCRPRPPRFIEVVFTIHIVVGGNNYGNHGSQLISKSSLTKTITAILHFTVRSQVKTTLMN